MNASWYSTASKDESVRLSGEYYGAGKNIPTKPPNGLRLMTDYSTVPRMPERRASRSFESYNPRVIEQSRHQPQDGYFGGVNHVPRRHIMKKLPSNEEINRILSKKLMSMINDQQHNQLNMNQQLERDINRVAREMQQKKTIEQQIIAKRIREEEEERIRAKEEDRSTKVALNQLVQALNKISEAGKFEVKRKKKIKNL